MKELPENQTLAKQLNATGKGRIITEVFNATKYHKNTFYYGYPLTYGKLLSGKETRLALEGQEAGRGLAAFAGGRFTQRPEKAGRQRYQTAGDHVSISIARRVPGVAFLI